MAEAVVSIALETFKDLLLEEGKFLAGVGSEAKALQIQLTEIKCLLKDADRKQHESEMVRNWIGEIRDLAYRAEDAIASYAVRISSDARRKRSLKRLLCRFSNALSCFSLHQLGQEISAIKSELARVTKSMQEYGIKSIIDGPESINENWVRKTFPNFQIGDCFVGKEEELKRLCSLVGDDKQHRVISIWGMGGIGKTTIAKKVYNQMIQTKKFDCFAWVCITQQCQTRTVLEGVFKLLDPQKGEGVSSLSDEQLIEQLCEIQRNKRCLVVVDDLWEVSHWDGFKHGFLVEDLKSKILVTTRKKYVADIGFPVELGFLNMAEALELLKKKSFPQGNYPEFASQESLQKIGKEMVRKCGYLPLAISLLGGVLSKKISLREWELVYSNIDSSIYSSGDDSKGNDIKQVLHLSYQDLPYFLKPCFLLLARWKEDEDIDAYKLYSMWIAQGMISYDNIRRKEETLMEIAELCLGELASRCIVRVEVDVDNLGDSTQKYKTCRLHDVVRELCVSIGTNENFGVQILEYSGGKSTTLLQEGHKTRHLVMHFKEERQLEDGDHVAIASRKDSKHLRSLQLQNFRAAMFPFPGQSIVDLQMFAMLKSLIIIRFKFTERKFPRGITKLIHLKHLCLEFCEIDELPSSICCLAYLEQLSLYGSWDVRVPDDLNKLSRLKYLYLPFYHGRTTGNYRVRLDVSGELETLMWFDSSVHELVSITRMKNLRLFSAAIWDNESLSTITNIIATEWKKLRFCVIRIEQGCELTSEEGQTKLRQVLACPNLYKLEIAVRLCKQLSECERDIISSKLVVIKLVKCEIEDNPMAILGKLPTLKELILLWNSFVGEELRCPALSFPSLRYLELECLPNWRELRVENCAMPLLRKLRISRCPNFQKIPDGLSCISTLEELRVVGMPALGRRVLETGEDFHNVCHIPSVNVYSS